MWVKTTQTETRHLLTEPPSLHLSNGVVTRESWEDRCDNSGKMLKSVPDCRKTLQNGIVTEVAAPPWGGESHRPPDDPSPRA